MILHVGGIARGTLPAIVDPADGITPTTPSALTALVIKNGTDTVDLVTITAVGGGRTGVYKWSYDPAEEAEGDKFSLVFEITISGDPYYHTVDIDVVAVERGTDGANTTAPDNASVTAIKAKTDNLPTDPADQSAVEAAITAATSGLATAANMTKALDRLGYIMAQEIGACADAGTSAETYAITIDTTTYTIDHTGLDATGNRGTATLTKT